MLPKYPEFKNLEVGDAEVIGEYVRFAPDVMCEYSFANLMIWRDFDRPSFTFIDGNLCIKINPVDDEPFFLEPMGGQNTRNAKQICMEHTGRFSRVSAGFIFSLNGGGHLTKELNDHFDYVYCVDELAKLKGRKFDGKRNRIKKLKRDYPNCEYVRLTKAHGREALRLFEIWRESKGCSVCTSDLSTCCQKKAVERAFEIYDEMGLLGGALISRGELLGFAIGSDFKDDTACLHLLYTKPEVQGAFQMLLWEACKGTFSDFSYINLEQDLGISGIRKNKVSYHPLRLVKKFEVTSEKK